MNESAWDDEQPLQEWEYPDEPEDDELDTPTRDCPMCGVEVYEDASVCPICGEQLVWSNPVWSGRPYAWIALGMVGMIAVILAMVLG